MTQSDLTNFKNGIFALNTRRFGFIAEIMIKQIFGCVFSKDKPSNASKTKEGENKKNFDLYSEEFGNIEVKFSRVLESEPVISELSAFDVILNSKLNKDRILKSSNKENFDCNIQQVKPKFFHTLFYGLFFEDKIKIYSISDVEYLRKITDSEFSGSDKQHSGNEGEGQFHIKQSNIKIHDEFFDKEYSYEELFDLFQNIKNKIIDEIKEFLIDDINCKDFNTNSIHKFLFPKGKLTKRFDSHIEKIRDFTTKYDQYKRLGNYELDFLFSELTKLREQSLTRKKEILRRFVNYYSKPSWIGEKTPELDRLKNTIVQLNPRDDIEKLYNSLKGELDKLGEI